MDELKALEQQLEQARFKGREEAAAVLIAAAERYDALTGHCAPVLAHELRHQAKAIREGA
jgi:hypothetical protein